MILGLGRIKIMWLNSVVYLGPDLLRMYSTSAPNAQFMIEFYVFISCILEMEDTMTSFGSIFLKFVNFANFS